MPTFRDRSGDREVAAFCRGAVFGIRAVLETSKRSLAERVEIAIDVTRALENCLDPAKNPRLADILEDEESLPRNLVGEAAL